MKLKMQPENTMLRVIYIPRNRYGRRKNGVRNLKKGKLSRLGFGQLVVANLNSSLQKNTRTSPDVRVFQKLEQTGSVEPVIFANLFFSHQLINQGVEFGFKLFVEFPGCRAAESGMNFPYISLFIDKNGGWEGCDSV